ncbi:2-hydroxychromene-2-carboxylate isomerase [Jannaschia sp. M317]|uniref:2-hydroxychromene-2-carboxylate isomerase n=1 Tax=Jannaschia sp. M317 TaxID=2867011 RepID=UPI0021A3B0A9|nr:2-hydroxychromene-2-carboxylate isomerase [Jannaschia sp. M317]UWQ17310.1 2-hydroxychromene-2-carboxylate isomerase [Jannaschia sp. M317]
MKVITYYYSAHSAFAYLGSARLAQICAAEGAVLLHRPVPLSPVVEAQGSLAFRARTQAHVDYFFGREIERWAEWRGVPVVSFRPTFHDADYSLASGMILALGDRGAQVDAMAHALLQAHWRDDADLSDRATLAALAVGLGHDPDALLARAAGPEAQAQFDANGAEALALGVMGSPTYVVDGDMFYGQDRLEMVERALTRPFAAPRWRNPPVDGDGI